MTRKLDKDDVKTAFIGAVFVTAIAFFVAAIGFEFEPAAVYFLSEYENAAMIGVPLGIVFTPWILNAEDDLDGLFRYCLGASIVMLLSWVFGKYVFFSAEISALVTMLCACAGTIWRYHAGKLTTVSLSCGCRT